MTSDRRQFTRLPIAEQAIAFDEDGRRLGLVTEVGGGGMAITLDADISAETFQVGTRMRIMVVEPQKEIRNSLKVELRYIVGNLLGMAFTDSRAAHQ